MRKEQTTAADFELENQDEFPTCEDCGETISGPVFSHDGETYCKDCYKSRFFTCSGCGETFENDNGTAAEDGIYCEDCLNDSFIYCEDCEEYHAAEDAVTVHYRNRNYRVQEKIVCEDCAENYPRCEDCREYWDSDYMIETGHGYSICFGCYETGDYSSCGSCRTVLYGDDLIYSERHGECYCRSCYEAEGGNAINDYNYKPAAKFRHYNQRTKKTVQSRTPSNRLYLGFELEVESDRQSPHDVASDIIERFDESEDLFYCKHDGSLDDGFEIVTHPLTLRSHKVQDYPDMLEVLKKAGCRSQKTDTCGLHVHVSRAFFSQSETVKLGLFVYFNKSRLETFARRSEVSYAKFKPVRRSDLQDAATSNERYEAINFEPCQTIEFRLFRGTLKAETLLATLEFCDAASRFVKTVSACVIVNRDGGFAEFKSFVYQDGNRKLYKNLIAYATERGLF